MAAVFIAMMLMFSHRPVSAVYDSELQQYSCPHSNMMMAEDYTCTVGPNLSMGMEGDPPCSMGSDWISMGGDSKPTYGHEVQPCVPEDQAERWWVRYPGSDVRHRITKEEYENRASDGAVISGEVVPAEPFYGIIID